MDISCIAFSKRAGAALLTAMKESIEILELECRNCSLTDTQEVWLRLTVERNNFYHNNPCLVKDFFMKEDEVEIEKWLKRVK